MKRPKFWGWSACLNIIEKTRRCGYAEYSWALRIGPKKKLNHFLKISMAPSTVQSLWDQPVFEQRYQELLDNQPVPTEKARLMAIHSEHSSGWLSAVPIKDLGLKLDDRSFQLAMGLHLGVSLCHPYKCGSCGLIVDTTARHGLSCIWAEGTKPRHDKVNDILLRAQGSSKAHLCTWANRPMPRWFQTARWHYPLFLETWHVIGLGCDLPRHLCP